MKIIVFGATGLVGKRLVEQGLAAGHQVTAFVLPAGEYSLHHERLRLVRGDVLHAGQVHAALRGQEAVLSALGARGRGDAQPVSLVSEGIHNILRAMHDHGVERIISVAGTGLLQANADQLIKDQKGYPAFLLPISADHQNALKLLEASQRKWTLMCPPYIPDGDPSGSYEVKVGYAPVGKQVLSGDLAKFMLEELKNEEFLSQRVGIVSK